MIKQKSHIDKELDDIRKQQQMQHELFLKDQSLSKSLKKEDDTTEIINIELPVGNTFSKDPEPAKKNILLITLQDQTKIKATLIQLLDYGSDKWRIIFKDSNKHFFTYNFTLILNGLSIWVEALRQHLNYKLDILHKNVKKEFPEWIKTEYGKEKLESNNFTIENIEEAYKLKKAEFGMWRFAMLVGLFNSPVPQSAKFNKIVNIQVRTYSAIAKQ